jgi:CRP-like cAMP-binding protein
MPLTDQSALRNHLLASLPPRDFALLAGELEGRQMRRGEVLARPSEVADFVYFPEAGILSLVAVSKEGHRVEAGLLGRDGFGPLSVATKGASASVEAMVQGEGAFNRLPAATFQALLDESGEMNRMVRAYLHIMSVQAAFTSLSNAVHLVEERLARWLIMCHDRTDGDHLTLTHDFIALMLAVRRPSVTTALHVLEGSGFIRSDRGLILIRDRGALEAFAAAAYGGPEAEYARLLGDFRLR